MFLYIFFILNSVTGNPSLCTSGKACSTSPGTTESSSGGAISKKKSSKMPIVLGTTIPTFFLIWIVVGIFVILRRKRTNNVNVSAVPGGGANGKLDGLHVVSEQMMNGIGENAAQQTFGSPSPLLDTSGQTSDLHDQTTAH